MSEEKTIEELKEPVSLTEKRDKRCAIIVEEIMQKMLDENLLFSDQKHLEREIQTQIEILFKNCVIQMTNDIYQLLTVSLNESFKRTMQKSFGKGLDELSLKDADEILKKK